MECKTDFFLIDKTLDKNNKLSPDRMLKGEQETNLDPNNGSQQPGKKKPINQEKAQKTIPAKTMKTAQQYRKLAKQSKYDLIYNRHHLLYRPKEKQLKMVLTCTHLNMCLINLTFLMACHFQAGHLRYNKILEINQFNHENTK